MIWDEFLRHFRFCDEEDSGLSDGAKRTKKSPKAHTKTDTSSQEKLFGEIQNSFLKKSENYTQTETSVVLSVNPFMCQGFGLVGHIAIIAGYMEAKTFALERENL